MATVAETLVALVRKYDSPASCRGHGHRALREVLLGSTTQELIKTAPCPVVVAGTHADLDEMKAMNHARVNFIAINPEWPGEVVQFINSEARPRALRPAGGRRLPEQISSPRRTA